MNNFRITLRAGDMMIGEDEIEPLIKQLEALRQKKDESGSDKLPVYIDYETVRQILRQQFPSEGKLRVRLGNLWSCVAHAALHDQIAYDAICTACHTQLREHTERSPQCYELSKSSASVAVSAASLRAQAQGFMLYRARKSGPAARADYRYLIDHLPEE